MPAETEPTEQLVDKVYTKKDLIQFRDADDEDEDGGAEFVSGPGSGPGPEPEPEVEPRDGADGAECEWEPGSLAWARVGSHPLWPCLVTRDPETGLYARRKTIGRAAAPSLALHVTFFADNGRHSWLLDGLLMPFAGLDDFERRKAALSPETRRRRPKLCSAFQVREAKMPKWLSAVAEAEVLLRRPPELRRAPLPDADARPPPRRAKRASLPRPPSAVDSLFDSLLESDRASAASAAETVAETPAPDEDPDFRAWLDANGDFHRDLNPELDEREFLAYARRLWEYDGDAQLGDMKNGGSASQVKGASREAAPSPVRRARRPTRRRADDRSDDGDDSPGAEEDGDAEPPPPPPPPPEPGPDERMESLKVQKPNVFKGLTKERACEVCETTGDLVKCTGACRGTFHEACCARRAEAEARGAPRRSRKERKRRGRPRARRRASAGSDSGSSENAEPARRALDDADADEFEALASREMAEMIARAAPPRRDGETGASLDWSDAAPGRCEIVEWRERSEPTAFVCDRCRTHGVPLCFACGADRCRRSGSDVRRRCGAPRCDRFYHPECLEAWPQTRRAAREELTCPRHVCHTCVSDDPKGCETRFSGDRLARCLRCPAAYHSLTRCVPAGSRLVSASQIVCPRHGEEGVGKAPSRVNTSWCFICAKGGTLICCETCPTSFHAECLNIPTPEGGYVCEECETGRLPLYEELVWVKLGQYRWWPALVLHPCDVPPNIEALPHLPGQFAVRFFGVYDHYWVSGGRVFPYQEGDTGHASSRKSSVDSAFLTAVRQAREAYAIVKEQKRKRTDDGELSTGVLPPKFVKLKVNRAVGNAVFGSRSNGEVSKCDCDPGTENPCAPDTDCLNRMLLTECSPRICAAGDRCCNRAFEKRLYPPLQPSRTSERGWGLKTLADIKKGDFIIEYVGEVIDETEFRDRMKRRQEMRDENYYFLTLDKDRMIDAGPKGNNARFMNHSCDPNCETQKWTVNGDTRVGLFALKDVPAGSELTFNYNLVCAGDDKKKCMCGTKRCAGYIGAKPKQEEPPPKKPKKIRPKRKYRRRKVKNGVEAAKPPNRTKHFTNGFVDSDLQGIDRDVEIIKNSLLDIDAEDKYRPDDSDARDASTSDGRSPYDAERRDDSPSENVSKKIKRRVRQWKGLKRKRPASDHHRRAKMKKPSACVDRAADAVHVSLFKCERDDAESEKDAERAEPVVVVVNGHLSNGHSECKKEETDLDAPLGPCLN